MIQLDWSFEFIALLATIYVLTLVLAAVIAKRLDGRRDNYIDLLTRKLEELDEQMTERRHTDSELAKKLKIIKEELGHISSHQQKLGAALTEREKSGSGNENLLASHSKEIKELQDSITEIIDSFNAVELEEVKMELHLAKFAIRKGRHQLEELSRVTDDLDIITGEEFKPDGARRSAGKK